MEDVDELKDKLDLLYNRVPRRYLKIIGEIVDTEIELEKYCDR